MKPGTLISEGSASCNRAARILLGLSGTCIAGAILLPFIGTWLAAGPRLGETGSRLVWGSVGLLLSVSLLLGVSGLLAANPFSLRSTLDLRYPSWRWLTAHALGTAILLLLAATLLFLGQFLTILGPGPAHYLAADWLGIRVLIPDEPFGIPDFFTAVFLLLASASAVHGLMNYLLYGSEARLPMPALALLAAGLGLLALDEHLTIHEFLGANLPYLRDSHLTRHPDDVIMLIYFVVALIGALRYSRFIFRDWVSMTLCCLGLVLQGLAALADGFLPDRMGMVEELLELAAAGTCVVFVSRCASPVDAARCYGGLARGKNVG